MYWLATGFRELFRVEPWFCARSAGLTFVATIGCLLDLEMYDFHPSLWFLILGVAALRWVSTLRVHYVNHRRPWSRDLVAPERKTIVAAGMLFIGICGIAAALVLASDFAIRLDPSFFGSVVAAIAAGALVFGWVRAKFAWKI